MAHKVVYIITGKEERKVCVQEWPKRLQYTNQSKVINYGENKTLKAHSMLSEVMWSLLLCLSVLK